MSGSKSQGLKHPAVAVHWLDAHMTDEQLRPDEITHKPARQVTIGFLLRDDAVGVSLAVEYNHDDPTDVRTTYFIPRGMIRRVQRLR